MDTAKVQVLMGHSGRVLFGMLGERAMLIITAAVLGFCFSLANAQDAPPPADPDVLDFLQDLFQNEYGAPFVPGESSLLITPAEGENTYAVQVGLGTIDDPDDPALLLDGGLYVEAESFLIANEDLSEEALDGDGTFLVTHRAFAGTLLTPSGGAIVVSGLVGSVTLDGVDEDLGEVDFVTLIPFQSHDTLDSAVVAAAALTDVMKIAYGVATPIPVQVESGESSSASVCISQYNLCLRSAAFGLSACRKDCTAAGLIAVPGLCLGSLACGVAAPICCLATGGAAVGGTYLCLTKCIDNYNADVLDCEADLLGCDPSIVIVPH